jgi:hypothetical protein
MMLRPLRLPTRARTAPLALLLGLLALLLAAPATALPRQTLMSGTPCSACHVNVQGGGMRTEIGWGSMAYSGALTWDQLGFNWLDQRMTNEVAPGWALGLDYRGQLARRGPPALVPGDNGQLETVPASRDFFPMQVQPYLSGQLTDWLQVYGTWAGTPQTFEQPTFCSEDYPGQSCYEAQAIFRPGPTLPTVRVGQLQPSVGIRHDDHTMLIRSIGGRTMLPPQWAETGGEVTWQPRYWVQVDGGVFGSRNLTRAVGDARVLAGDTPAYSGRVRFSPQVHAGPVEFTSWLGGSALGAGAFQMYNGFVGLGALNRVSWINEIAHLRYGNGAERTGRNLGSTVSVRATDWLFGHVRYETAQQDTATRSGNTQALVTGFEFFPVPYLELRPEYRYVRTPAFHTAQYTLQIHLFY